MADFFLKPFLDILTAAGIRVTIKDYERITLALRADGPWDLERLRGVLLALLVKSPEQEELFIQQFDSFFDSGLNIDVTAELQHVPRPSTPPSKRVIAGDRPASAYDSEGDLQGTQHQADRRPLNTKRYAWLIAVGVLLIVSITAFLIILNRPRSQPGVLPTPTPIITPTRTRGPEIELPKDIPASSKYALLAYFLVLTYFLLRRLFAEKRPPIAPAGPRHFNPSIVGGDPLPLLESAVLEHCAGIVGYRPSEKISRSLDMRASVDVTARSGGLPTLIYRKQKLIKTVFILEDSSAESLAWNRVPRELQEGLRLRGVPVVYGRFFNSLERFETTDRIGYWLDELEAESHGHPVMIFSDCRRASRARDAAALQVLARMPTLAWMELREPRFWDENTELIARHGIPVYPATSRGILDALSRLQTEQNLRSAYPPGSLTWPRWPTLGGGDLPFKVERLLGEALPWAQACAMIQPLSLGLADSLRRRFQPHLPPELIGRLFALPGTTYTNSGLRFSDAVLATLRSGFVIRWNDEEQEEILKYILKKLGEVEPEQQNSLAHLSWQWIAARVRLELEPDGALKDIERLMRTPLGNHIKAEIENIYFADSATNMEAYTAPVRIPVRRASKGKLPRQGPTFIGGYGGEGREQNETLDGRWEQVYPLGLDPMLLHSDAIQRVVGTIRRPADATANSGSIDRRDGLSSATAAQGYDTKVVGTGAPKRVMPETGSGRNAVSGLVLKVGRIPVHVRVFASVLAVAGLGIAANGLPVISIERLEWVVSNLTEPIGSLFLRLMLITIIPLVFSSLVVGIAGIGNTRRFARIFFKSFVYILAISAISAAIGLAITNAIRPGERLAAETRLKLEADYGEIAGRYVNSVQRMNETDSTLMQIVKVVVPENPLASAAGIVKGVTTQSDMPNMFHLMFFAIFLGTAVTFVPLRVRAPLLRGAEALYEVSTKLADIVIKFTPVAVACLLFTSVARFDYELMISLGWFVTTVLLGLALHLFGVHSLTVYLMWRLPPLEFIRRIRGVMLTAFSTSSSNATLPVALRVTGARFGVPREINNFVLTVGSLVNQNGSVLYACASVLFLAQLVGVELTYWQQFGIASLTVFSSIGTSRAPAASIPLIITILAAYNIPAELVAVIIGVDRLLDMCRTTINVTGDIAAATYVARSEGYESLGQELK